MSHTIRVEGVSKKFDLQLDRARSIKELITRRNRDASRNTFWALKDVSLEIEEGSMFALIGHNGSGKSTLLRCIAGIYQPNAGSVTVDGRISTLLELGAGFHPDLSGRENIYLNATILGMPRKEIDRRFDEIVAFAGVEQFIDSPVKVYSTGMYVRLGFSVAVHVDPEILIIDEVIAVGDEQFQRRCFDHLYGLRKQGVTIVVVTHGMGTVETMCDAAAWLDHGELQMVGPAPEVAAAYLERVNAAEAVRRFDDGAHLVDQGESVVSPRSGKAVEIVSMELRDRHGQVVEAVEHGADMEIAIRYRLQEPMSNLVFGIGLHTDGGVAVSGTNTQISGVASGRLPAGDGEAAFLIDALPLIAGNYEISSAITDQHVQHEFDRLDRTGRLLVRRGSHRAGVGIVEIPGRWRLSRPT